ncbi:hypothetical protein D3C81_1781430 [compost metagenome]
MAIEFDMVDRRIGLQVIQDHFQSRARRGIQLDASPREPHLRLAHLVIVHRQHLAGTRLIITPRLGKAYRQHTHFDRPPRLPGVASHHRTAAIEQPIDQAAGLALG